MPFPILVSIYFSFLDTDDTGKYGFLSVKHGKNIRLFREFRVPFIVSRNRVIF